MARPTKKSLYASVQRSPEQQLWAIKQTPTLLDKVIEQFNEAGAIAPEDEAAMEAARELEAQGVFVWLKTIFPDTFAEEFSDDHKKFWLLWWSILMRIRKQQELERQYGIPRDQKEQIAFLQSHDCWIDEDEWAILLILARGLGKSTISEVAGVMRGAILNGGYCLYVCDAQDQADEHVSNCRGLIESEDSALLVYYPQMSIDTNATFQGKKLRDTTDMFVTKNGWICRARGIKSKMRGLRFGNRRPDHIILDDIDDVNDSMTVSDSKQRFITASVLPTRARRWATITFAQNLIIDTGVLNRIYESKVDVLSARTAIGVTNAFKQFREGIEYKTTISKDGRIKHVIQPCAEPTWSGLDLIAAQQFLNDSGLETFLAEYMNSFEHQKAGKVFHEWNEARHIITWSDFEGMFGKRHIPAHWGVKVTADLGYTDKSVSAWVSATVSAENSPMPGRYFIYQTKTFVRKSIDEQAVELWADWFPDPTTGKNFYDASQDFKKYPELFRALRAKARAKDWLADHLWSPTQKGYRPRARHVLEDTPPEFVLEAENTFAGHINQIVISHEKSGEQRTLARQYGIPATKTKDFKKTDGIAEANHLLRGDFTVPHPFFEDERDENGLYKLGSPYIFVIVDDDQEFNPVDDGGAKTFREQIAQQPWTIEKVTELGLVETVPLKIQSDHCDAFRMFAANYAIPSPTELSAQEMYVQDMGEYLVTDRKKVLTPAEQLAIMEKKAEVKRKHRNTLGLTDDDEELNDFIYDEEY